nr:hypothetical protein [Tanacetum cinerariifolium]
MVSVTIQQDTSSIPSMTTPKIDLNSRPDSINVHRPLQATATETTTTHPPPPQPQQSTTYSMLMKRIGELEHIMANLIQDNKHLEERLDSHRARLYTLENQDIPHQSFRVKKTFTSLNNTPQISSVNAIAPVLPTQEPKYSLSMGYENLNTTPEIESGKIIKSSVEKLVPIQSGDDNAFEDIKYVEASHPNFELVSLEEENDVYQEEKEFDLENILQIQDVILREKLLSINHLIADIEFLNDNPTPDRVLKSSFSFPIFKKSDNSLSYSDNSLPEFETFSDHTEDTRSGSTTAHANNSLLEYDLFCFKIKPDQGRLTSVVMKDISDNLTNDPLLEEVDLFLASDNSIPPGIGNIDYDSEEDIYFLEELLSNDSIPLPKNESSNFDHHDDPSFPRPPLEPPDVEFFFDFEPNLEELIAAVINNIDKLIEDECFDPGGGKIDVFTNIEDDDYFPFIFVILIFYRISFTLRFLLYFSPLGVKTPFLTLESPFRAGGISSGRKFNVV